MGIKAVSAQEQDQAKGNTGNQSYKLFQGYRAYTEISNLNTRGDGTQSVTTLELHTPFAEGKW